MTPPAPRHLSRSLTTVIAVANGVIVADLYYLQPLLHQLRGDFGLTASAASLLVTLLQLGYAGGLVLVAPLGDRVGRRHLAVGVYLVAALSMAGGALAPTYAALVPLALVIGVASVGAQVLIPLAADLADPGQRGRVLARVMSGLLLGVLLSRTASGLIAQALGWRAVFGFAALALVLTAAVLWRVLPDEAPKPRVAYRHLVAGSFRLLASQPGLRRRAWYGALIFAAISLTWTEIAFHLSAAPFHYSKAVIGLFGLFGVAGVLAANVAGHHADRRRERGSTVVAASAITASFLVLLAGGSLVALGAGLVLLDAGMQGMQITNQSIIYRLVPDSRGRATSAYMTCSFLGAAAGSLVGGLVYQRAGWTGVCWTGVAIGCGLLAPALGARRAP
ncbi:MAG: MFS transporter [Acidobacteriota bacterium]|nr:MFS transporter [Acidobacteriota bacterium]